MAGSMNKASQARGFTLIELMITVAVVGILAAVAYPAYTNQIAKGRRAECRAGLFMAMQQQERYFTQYNAYATAGTVTNNIRTFSGDSADRSACTLSAVSCGTGCVRMVGTLVKTDPAGITELTFNSAGEKACKIGGGSLVTGNKDCWP